MTPAAIIFLTTEDVFRLHSFAIEDQGGNSAIISPGLLDAALAMPPQRFGGEYLHPDMPSMAAAYAFHICGNHAFADGNKRAALGAMVAFLALNTWVLDVSNEEAERVIVALAAGQVSKDHLTEWAKKNCRPTPRLGS